MATKPEVFNLTPRGARKHTVRDTSHKAQHYGRAWQKLRLMQLRAEPLCRACKAAGRITTATEVDHIQRLRWGGTNHADNLQSLCKSCHSRKTANEEQGGRATGR